MTELAPSVAVCLSRLSPAGEALAEFNSCVHGTNESEHVYKDCASVYAVTQVVASLGLFITQCDPLPQLPTLRTDRFSDSPMQPSKTDAY